MGKMLKRGQLIAGVAAIRVRNALRGLRGYSFDAGTLALDLKLSAAEASVLFAALLKRRLVRQNRLSAEGWSELTPAGTRFTLMRAIPPISRAKAERLVEKAVAACAAINADGAQPFYVVSLCVFGSYLGDRPELGDVDLSVDMRPRNAGLMGREWDDWNLRYGRRHVRGSFLTILGAASFAVRARLKNRSAYVSVHTVDEVTEMGVPMRVLFTAGKVAKPRPA